MSGWNNLHLFHAWCQKVLPLVYDESLSYYEVLCKVMDYINQLIENDIYEKEHLDLHAQQIAELQRMVQEIQAELTAIENGEAEGLYINALRNYIDNHLEEIVGRVVKFVVFGLSNDGYFTALIPKTWDFITFDTIMDCEDRLYGHLVLEW